MPERATDLVELRRTFHARPELGFLEIETAARVIAELDGHVDDLQWGEPVCDLAGLAGLPSPDDLTTARERARGSGVPDPLIEDLGYGATAVLARVRGTRPGPVVAIRFDMDALPVTESDDDAHVPTALGFASANPGLMHACGHDCHVAVGITLGRRLAANRDFPGEVVLLFQPAEEGVRGARAMVAAGATDGVDVMLGMHVGIDLPAGTVAAAAEGVLATEKWRCHFTGRPSHAALAPHEGRNALLGAATATLGLHALPPVSGAVTRVNVGRLVAGTSANVIAAEAVLDTEIRASDDGVLADLSRRGHAVIDGAATAHGLTAEVEVTGASAVARCDAEVVEAVLSAAADVPAIEEARRTAPMTASDDVTLFMAEVQRTGGQATFVLVGGGSPAPHHTSRFDIDESALPVALDLLEGAVRAGL
ncbi:amidohydrolase [Ruania alba]|uniref:Aminobenzoyl-glutamate utilization protein A n=1 Tax=Ruania alba TaxID=648782 RepID=A0A1H5HML2_9MICO|nr:amidohydrolase [Ruania alba]SEE29217.1 aminobenzoyl-glutamate utilization protein A [Ruania alba]